MRRTALTLTVSTLVLSVFGAFLHWLQTMNAFEKDTGFSIPGAGTTVVFLIYSVLAVALFCVVTILWLGRFERGTDAASALHCETVIPFVAGAIFLSGSGFSAPSASLRRSPFLSCSGERAAAARGASAVARRY